MTVVGSDAGPFYRAVALYQGPALVKQLTHYEAFARGSDRGIAAHCARIAAVMLAVNWAWRAPCAIGCI